MQMLLAHKILQLCNLLVQHCTSFLRLHRKCSQAHKKNSVAGLTIKAAETSRGGGSSVIKQAAPAKGTSRGHLAVAAKVGSCSCKALGLLGGTPREKAAAFSDYPVFLQSKSCRVKHDCQQGGCSQQLL